MRHDNLHNRTGVIPHDHDAWVNPTWMNNLPASKQVKPVPAKALRTAEARPLDKPHTRRIPRPSTGLRILQPPSHIPRTERASSPGFPPVTASQFADADEDFGVVNFKVEPATPARPVSKPVASKSRTNDVVQSTSTPRGQSTVAVSGHSKQSRASSGALGNGTRAAQVHKYSIRNGGHTSKGQVQDSNRPLTAHQSTPDNGFANREVRPDDSAPDTTQSTTNTTAPRPYLGGFQPSITVNLPRKYQLTWENWVEVTKDAYTFWLE